MLSLGVVRSSVEGYPMPESHVTLLYLFERPILY